MKVLVVGSGYVGLVAAVGFAEAGHNIVCVDIDHVKIESLKQGVSPIYEPGLENLLKKHLESKSLNFSVDIYDGIIGADVAFICVGTPQGDDGSADLKYVLSVATEIGRSLAHRSEHENPLIVVTKSTVPVGTSTRVNDAINSETTAKFEVVSNPEFLREGSAIEDFLFPDRVVVGCNSEFALQIMRNLYQPHLDAAKLRDPQRGNLIAMDTASAEMTKYAANAMLALRISFINEIAGLCEKVGANVDYVRDGIGSDHRIGKYFLNPGPGFGGSCFPKDLQALLKVGRENGYPLRCLESTVEANRHQKQVIAKKIKDYFGCRPGIPTPMRGRRIALWGLAFKAHTDDIREAMALELIESLIVQGAKIVAHDFEAMPNVKAKIGDKISYVNDPMEACVSADALIIATEWPQYQAADLKLVGSQMKSKIIFDGRNLFNPGSMRELGWEYYSIGR